MTRLTPGQVFALARQAGFSVPGAVTMTAIVGAESGYRTDAIGDENLTEPGEMSVGLTQINYRPSRDRGNATRDPHANLDPATNLRHAYEISGAGKRWTPWSTYTSGAYRSNLAAAQAAVGSSAAPSTTGPTPTPPRPSNVPADATWDGKAWSWVDTSPHSSDMNGKDPFGDAVTGAGKAVVGALDLPGKIREIVLTSLFVLGGVALVAAGVWRGTEPAREKAGDAAAVALAPETGGASLAAKGAT